MREYKIDITCLLMTNIFGCNDDFSINGRIVPSIIANIKQHVHNNSDMIINANKNTLVNLVYVDDISKIVELCILQENISGSILVFNKNGTIMLEKLTNIIASIFNYKKNIIFTDDTCIVNNNIMKPNLGKFNYFFENFRFTELEKALKITCDSL